MTRDTATMFRAVRGWTACGAGVQVDPLTGDERQPAPGAMTAASRRELRAEVIRAGSRGLGDARQPSAAECQHRRAGDRLRAQANDRAAELAHQAVAASSQRRRDRHAPAEPAELDAFVVVERFAQARAARAPHRARRRRTRRLGRGRRVAVAGGLQGDVAGPIRTVLGEQHGVTSGERQRAHRLAFKPSPFGVLSTGSSVASAPSTKAPRSTWQNHTRICEPEPIAWSPTRYPRSPALT